MGKFIGIVVAVVVVVGAFMLLSRDSNAPVESASPSPSEEAEAMNESPLLSPSASSEAMTDESSVPSPSPIIALKIKSFTVLGSPFQFDVKEIRVKQGDTVRITFTNTEGFHDWVVDGFNARTKQLQAGQSETITFTADKTGTFEYYCSVGNHRELGMVGRLVVE